jgi:hypothetical protein
MMVSVVSKKRDGRLAARSTRPNSFDQLTNANGSAQQAAARKPAEAT